MKDLKNSWQTTLIGITVVAITVYHYLNTGTKIDWSEITSVLIGIGFIASKDKSDSHTKR